MKSIKRILVLVNPTASDHAGRQVWAALLPRFQQLFSSYDYEVQETQSKEHCIELGATTTADLVISVSGDGAVHDIAQGIMARPQEERPALTVVPVGSGNDFARTLGLPAEPHQAIEAIRKGRRMAFDVGRCNDTYFLETLSFGIDAAIAVNTYEKRKTTTHRGFMLYAGVAVSSIIHDLRKHHFTYRVDGGPPIQEDFVIFAIQNGPTYGGGFKVAPAALPHDGLFNVCQALDTKKIYALYTLAKMAGGKHEALPIIRTMTARSLDIELDQQVPVQVDGEALSGTHFDIEMCPQALDVIVAHEAFRHYAAAGQGTGGQGSVAAGQGSVAAGQSAAKQDAAQGA